MAVSVHTIAFKGPAGISFVLFMIALVFYVLGFGTNAWSKRPTLTGQDQYGMWESCICTENNMDQNWFTATQVLITIGLVGLILAVILTTLYMCVHRISKNATITALVSCCFIAALCMLVGIIIFGVEADNLDWSFAMAIIGMCFTFAAGVVSIIQMKQSSVACFN